MICFEITLNGRRLCVAGVDDGVLSSHVSRTTAGKTGDRADEIRLEAGGLADGEHLRWIDTLLSVGDEVTIRVIEANTLDVPIGHHAIVAGTHVERPVRVNQFDAAPRAPL